jgi:hypothetical protein
MHFLLSTELAFNALVPLRQGSKRNTERHNLGLVKAYAVSWNFRLNFVDLIADAFLPFAPVHANSVLSIGVGHKPLNNFFSLIACSEGQVA